MNEAAVLLYAHGTVERLDDLAAFVTNVRHGRPPPPELVTELRRRYEAIGGQSPLLDVTRELATKVEERLGVPTRVAMRLWHPYPREVVPTLGVKRVGVVPLAQYSSHVYGPAAEKDLAGAGVAVATAPSWGSHPKLLDAFAASIRAALAALPGERVTVLMTAHSLPQSIIDAGDPYERDFRASAAGIAERLGNDVHTDVAFQSQGFGGGAWLGPDLPAALDAVRARGDGAVVFAPIGFLADHVEILYDLDIEAVDLAKARGLRAVRAESLNASDALADVVADVARGVL